MKSRRSLPEGAADRIDLAVLVSDLVDAGRPIEIE